MNGRLAFALLAVFIGGATCDVVELRPCAGTQDACTIHEVRIDPCKEAPEVSCVIKKGNSAAISFDFTPNFSATKLKSMVYWANGLIDLPFLSMDSNACKFTTCPSPEGTSHTYSYQLEISKKLPTGTYPIKWELWNDENHKQRCCFMSSITLKK